MTIFTNSQTSTLNNLPSYSSPIAIIDQPSKYNGWNSPKWNEYLGILKDISPLDRAIMSLAIWTVGKGYSCSPAENVTLNHITGNGKETFKTILLNHFYTMKANGDAFLEIIRKDNDDITSQLLNLKNLNPSDVKVIYKESGIIEKYTIKLRDGTEKDFKPYRIFHTQNQKIADEIHGQSIVEQCKELIYMWINLLKNWDKVLKRNLNPLKIFHINTNDPVAFEEIKTLYSNMTKDYEALFIPGKKGEKFDVDIPNIPLENPLETLRYIESMFYQKVGVPRVIATSENFTQANGSMGYLTFEPTYSTEQEDFEQQLWNQLGLDIKFNRPPSLAGTVEDNAQKNTGNLSVQPNDQNQINPLQ